MDSCLDLTANPSRIPSIETRVGLFGRACARGHLRIRTMSLPCRPWHGDCVSVKAAPRRRRIHLTLGNCRYIADRPSLSFSSWPIANQASKVSLPLTLSADCPHFSHSFSLFPGILSHCSITRQSVLLAFFTVLTVQLCQFYLCASTPQPLNWGWIEE